MEIEGIVIIDLPLEEGVSQRTGNAWKKKGWVLETLGGQFPRKVKFDVFGDRVNTFNLEMGKSYAISVDVESREFNGRWYTDLRAYNYRLLDNAGVAPGQQGGYHNPVGQQPAGPQFVQQPAAAPQNTVLPQEDANDELPF